MRVGLYQIPKKEWCVKLPKSAQYPRHWKTTVDLEITLSDSVLKIKKGTIWDGGSVPRQLWWLFYKVDIASIYFLIHDELYVNKLQEIKRFETNIFKARKFADEEMNRWANKLSPETKIANAVFFFVIRKIGGFFYSRQIKIPT